MAVHPTRILVVDEDEAFSRSLVATLEPAGYDCSAAASPNEGRRLLEDTPFDAAVIDIGVRDTAGVAFLKEVSADHPDMAVIVVAAVDDPAVANVALDLHAFGYVVKPFHRSEILASLASALRVRHLELSQQLYIAGLETTISRMQKLGGLIEGVGSGPGGAAATTAGPGGTGDAGDAGAMERLSRAITVRNDETAGHLDRVARYATLIGQRVGLSAEALEDLRRAAPLHDIGKIGVPDAVLLKAGPLTLDERSVMQRHARLGYQLLSSGASSVARMAADIAIGHHEWWDGTGYPRGRRAEEIPQAARIVAVADVFDALTNQRVYRSALAPREAIEAMADLRGRQFEPRLFDAFVAEWSAVTAIVRDHPETTDERIRILIVDDELIFAQSLSRLLGAEPRVRVVGVAASVAEAGAAVRAYEPDVVLMDMQLPDGDGADATERIRAERPGTKVVMLTGRTDASALLRSIEAGCAGFVTKVETVDKLTAAILAAHAGEIPDELRNVPRLLSQLPATRRGLAKSLTPREIEILGLMATGIPNKQIARQLALSLNTVRNHVQSVLSKLESHSKLEAIAVAVRDGIIPPQRMTAAT